MQPITNTFPELSRTLRAWIPSFCLPPTIYLTHLFSVKLWTTLLPVQCSSYDFKINLFLSPKSQSPPGHLMEEPQTQEVHRSSFMMVENAEEAVRSLGKEG